MNIQLNLFFISALLSLFILSALFVVAQPTDMDAARTVARAYIGAQRYSYNSQRNIWMDDNNTIHIFIYEDGNLLIGGYPTTATEKDKFQVHVFVKSSNKDPYLLEYTGSFSPSLNIQNGNTKTSAATAPPEQLDFAVIGPFTGNLQLTLKHQVGSTYTVVASTTITIAKTIHVSIGTGLIYTGVRNPSNIKTHTLPTGDTTLVADETGGRGMLCLFATFYPGGRPNLLLNSSKFMDHFGLLVGTTINAGSSNFKDILLGVQYDFAAGGSIVAGGHYGKVQKILGVGKDFEFGHSVFTGSLEEKKYMDWDLGIFIGVQVDSRVFSQLFK
jgi:hypothetical protein